MARVHPSIAGTIVCIAPCRDSCDVDRGVDVMEREVLASTASLGLVTSPMTRCPDLAWRC